MDPSDFEEVLRTVRDFVRNQVVPLEDEIERTNAIPQHIRETAASMGLFGFALPQEHGGLGLSMSEDVRLSIELGYATPAFRSMFGTNNGIAGQVISKYGTEEQKERWLPELASGDVVASFALTEEGAGSDPSGLRTRAVRDGSDYLISGAKRFITNAPEAGLFVVFARTDENAEPHKGISVFLVEAGSAGLHVGPPDEKMGQAGALTAEVHFDSVRVPADALVGGEEGTGFSAAMSSLSRGRLHIAAICVGLAERILDEAIGFATTARQGGAPISRFQLVQAMLAESKAELYAARSMVLRAADEFDAGTDTRLAPSCAKLFCSEMVSRAADRAVQVHGGSGYMRGVPVERLFRDSRLFRIYEGTSEIQKLIIAKQLLRDA
ncbi:acyl-CoA dehydrogenase family protein [Saccharopolyspora rectivirgula]|jgi:acyl-CoA dehydrogenase|uniref:Acyl-CoA dehydrogenase n=1 Tax=Saccharopolyspora rectivirgula TaxID=28042 RepID=A0A073B154_9PSEU|nr:acyl-CoA dehydrogenase family protein [Saccharopolyspora rectivirgula]KEI45723.1 acyl-CoA dehydrogenase [Saccharopolyspora rectivirgula]